jgi:hypothetical protein
LLVKTNLVAIFVILTSIFGGQPNSVTQTGLALRPFLTIKVRTSSTRRK